MNQSPATTNVSQSRPWGKIIAWAALLLLLTIVGIGLIKAQRGQLAVGDMAPNFTLTTFDGQEISLEALRGKVVLLNIWASWCVPCKEEADDLETAWRLYRDRGDVLFVGVAYSDMDTKAKAYLKSYNTTYPNGPDMGTRIYQLYRATGVPETYVIDRTGKLVYVKFSPFQSVAEIQAAIEPLLK